MLHGFYYAMCVSDHHVFHICCVQDLGPRCEIQNHREHVQDAASRKKRGKFERVLRAVLSVCDRSCTWGMIHIKIISLAQVVPIPV